MEYSDLLKEYDKKVKRYLIIDIFLFLLVFILGMIVSNSTVDIWMYVYVFGVLVPFVIGVILTIINLFLKYRFDNYDKYKKKMRKFIYLEIIIFPLSLLIVFIITEAQVDFLRFLFNIGIFIPNFIFLVNTLFHLILIWRVKRREKQ